MGGSNSPCPCERWGPAHRRSRSTYPTSPRTPKIKEKMSRFSYRAGETSWLQYAVTISHWTSAGSPCGTWGLCRYGAAGLIVLNVWSKTGSSHELLHWWLQRLRKTLSASCAVALPRQTCSGLPPKRLSMTHVCRPSRGSPERTRLALSCALTYVESAISIQRFCFKGSKV